MMMGAAIGHDTLRVTLPTIFAGIANGTSITLTASAKAVITGGFGPFVHDWTDNLANVSMQASASVTSRIQATGTNIEHIGVYIYKITEANGAVTTVSAILNITQGTP